MEITPVKQGLSSFTLVGKANANQYTFEFDTESKNSDWVYNRMNLSIDCGEYGNIYAQMMGGFGSERANNFCYANGVDADGNHDVGKFMKIDWHDRLDEELLKTVSPFSLIRIELESGVEKRFLSEYDAIKYVSQHLDKDDVLLVQGDIEWNVWNGKVNPNKVIKSIRKIDEKPENFKATFRQSVYTTSDSIGSYDKEMDMTDFDVYVASFSKEFQGHKIQRDVNGVTKNGGVVPLMIPMYLKGNKNKYKKMLGLITPRGENVIRVVMEGEFRKGGLDTAEVTEKDIPEDIKTLIEEGYISMEEVKTQVARSTGSSGQELMFVTRPYIKIVNGVPVLDMDKDLYKARDLDPLNVLETFKIEGVDEVMTFDEKLDSAIDEVLEESSDDDWMDGLDDLPF